MLYWEARNLTQNPGQAEKCQHATQQKLQNLDRTTKQPDLKGSSRQNKANWAVVCICVLGQIGSSIPEPLKDADGYVR